ncbi:ribonuclease P protein component [Polynucleobacter sphagniphilus]|uniref:Ribonuclease P protein component n=1 Tax=Polynucleobacter sphagniphilus TaxID=1743169 RepID=A0AA43MB60_9BURK|nr:ribonuclease P protein component [Polynucleobacter sphagniphilus]MDF9789154.1 ribonuclease P protein component [Polynucleobacter sphagniphilus]MDH6155697.1 ribonuclease P protein component [Polynucleobacter sphagniphilus]MDH6242167.1 ribonuclease P protein component [Polynucleobacter sphagniphilus]MDH6249022.1 ribonuclease P protein component [Polynucleobacter sphagniphilus]MDH6299174.1 ribonuclease P protein component [Polynucleobacter sphagniphilus]
MNSARISELLKTRPKTSLCWGLYFAQPEKGIEPDLGIAVAKKLAKRAVDRNRLKRMIRELIRTAQASDLKSDVVVKLKSPIGRGTRGKLRKKEKILLRTQIQGLI